MAQRGYGVPQIEYRSTPQMGFGGQPNVNAGMGVNELFAAAMGSESYGRALNEAVRNLIRGRQGMGLAMARSGVGQQAAGFANQSAARSPLVKNPLNPAIETVAANQMQQAQSRALMDEMQRQIDAAKPSAWDNISGYALPIAGMALGGFGGLGLAAGGLSGAGAGASLGGLLSQMIRGY